MVGADIFFLIANSYQKSFILFVHYTSVTQYWLARGMVGKIISGEIKDLDLKVSWYILVVNIFF